MVSAQSMNVPNTGPPLDGRVLMRQRFRVAAPVVANVKSGVWSFVAKHVAGPPRPAAQPPVGPEAIAIVGATVSTTNCFDAVEQMPDGLQLWTWNWCVPSVSDDAAVG